MIFSRNIFLFFALFNIVSTVAAQHEMALHFMPTTLQTGIVNPALRPSENKWGLSLFGYNYNSQSSLPISKYISRTKFDSQGLLSQLTDADNTASFNGTGQLLAFGFGVRKLWIGVRSDIAAHGSATFPSGLPRLIIEGNAPYIGQTLQLAPTIDAGAYVATSVQVAYQFTDKWSAGITAKHLLGLVSFKTTQSDLSLYTDPEFYQLTLNTNYGFEMGGTNVDSIGVTIDSLGFPTTSNSAANNVYSHGLGFDVGASYRLNDKITINASLIGLGTVTWKDARYYSTQGTYYHDGAKITQLVGQDTLDFGVNLDSIFQGLNVVSTTQKVTYNLPATAYLSATYKLNRLFTFGALLQVERLNKDENIGGALHAQVHPVKWFQAGLTLGTRQRAAPLSLGFNIILKPGPFQLYYASDNVLSSFVPSTKQVSGHRLGLNLMFGKRNTDKI